MRPKQIVSHLKGENTKTLTKNFSALAILQLLRYFIPLIVLPYVTPIIGLEHFGEIAIASSFTLIVQVFVNYSFSFMGARDIARNRDDKDKVSEIVSKTIFAYIGIYAIMLVLSFLLIILVPKFQSIWLLISINLLTPIFSAMVCEWFFQGIEKMHNITIVNTLSRVLFLVLVFVLIKKEDDYILFPVCEVLGHILAGLYSIIMMTTKYKCKIHFPGGNSILDYIKQGKDLFLNQSCVLLFNRLPNILLGNISGNSAAGLYHAAFRLQEAGYHGVDTLNRTFFPFLARRMDKHKAYRRINLMFALFIAIVLFVFAPFLVRLLYAPDFAPAVRILRILSFSILFLGISSAYGVNHLLLIGEEKLVRNITFCVTGGGLLLLLLMIRLFNETGASLTMVIVNASFALSYFIASKKVKHKTETQRDGANQ